MWLEDDNAINKTFGKKNKLDEAIWGTLKEKMGGALQSTSGFPMTSENQGEKML